MCQLFLSSAGPLSPGRPVLSFIMGGASHARLFPSRSPRPRPTKSPLPCAAESSYQPWSIVALLATKPRATAAEVTAVAGMGRRFWKRNLCGKNKSLQPLPPISLPVPRLVLPRSRGAPRGRRYPYSPVAGAEGCKWEFGVRLHPKFDYDHHSILSYILHLLGEYSA